MKIQPRKTASLPKYAAVMAAAVMLTGCGYAGEIEAGGEPQIIDSQVQVEGDMQVCPEETEPVNVVPVQLEGDVALSAVAAEASEQVLREVFAGHGITLERADSAAKLAGNFQEVWLIDTGKKIIVTFYDKYSDMEKRYTENGAEMHEWGCICSTEYPHGAEEQAEYRTALIAAAPEDYSVTEAEAEQIAADLLGITDDTAEEPEEAHSDEN